MTTQVTTTGGATVNKRAGFIVGDTSQSGVNDVITAMASYPSERTYPSGLDGSTNPIDASGNVSSIDQIIGITGGVGGSPGIGEGVITDIPVACLYGDYTVQGVKTCAPAPSCSLGETYSVANGCGYITCTYAVRVLGYSVNGVCTQFTPSIPASCRARVGGYFDSSQNACGQMFCPGGFNLKGNLCVYQPLI